MVTRGWDEVSRLILPESCRLVQDNEIDYPNTSLSGLPEHAVG